MKRTGENEERFLVVTGGLISTNEKSILSFARRQLDSHRNPRGTWLDIQAKLAIVNTVLTRQLLLKSKTFRQASYRDTATQLFNENKKTYLPELTEVVLATLLDEAGVEFETATYAELHSNRRRRNELLARCKCVLASTTLIRDRAELRPLIEMLNREDNYLVLGGALTSMIWENWQDLPPVDLIAVGYGEYLVSSIVDWARSGFKTLKPRRGGRVENTGQVKVLVSGLPESKSLDHLSAPNWKLAERYHAKRFDMISYESVRGCAHRCMFCNYPFLFEDRKLRFRSASKVAKDWEGYAAQGFKIISALDSLFTMPRKRLRELCQILIEKNLEIAWICYARANDLADIETCELLWRAGCRQVHIGIESGNQQILDNMNKHCSVEQNALALKNCRQTGISTVITVIVGYPGETEKTVMDTFELLRKDPPDFYFAAALNTRFEHAPLLKEKNASRFGLITERGTPSATPYWRHDTMCCSETGRLIRLLNQKMMKQRVSLDCSLFLNGFYNYQLKYREDLLDFQYDVATKYRIVDRAFGWLNSKLQKSLEKDVHRFILGGAHGRATDSWVQDENRDHTSM